MTEQQLRQWIVDTFMSYLGAKQGSAKHKDIIDTYNNDKPLPRGYKVSYTDPWCATTVSSMAIKCNMKDLIPKECSCKAQISLFQQLGRWHEDDTYRPQIGDIVYYDWDDGPNYATTDDKKDPNHVGMVCESNGDSFSVIEGNKGTPGQVAIRYMKVNGRYIRGFGLPDYASKATEQQPQGQKGLNTYTKNGVFVVEVPVSCFKLSMRNHKKRDMGQNYCNANFFATYSEENKTVDFTLPVGHLVCDYKVNPKESKSDKYCDKYCHERGTFNDDKFTFDSNKWSFDNGFFGNALTTLQVKGGKAWISDIISVPAGLDYAVTGIPIMIKGKDVSWTNYVRPQGWNGSELYATSHIFVGIKQEQADMIYVMGWTSKTNNMVSTSEAYKTFSALGMYSVMKLDGGGSYFINANGTTKATTENRRINAIIEFAAAGTQCPYTEPFIALKQGSSSTTGVKWIQWQLNRKGYTCEIDGSFGPITDVLVRQFQKANNIAVDGIVGPATRKLLKG